MDCGKAALMVYGVMRERYSEEAFREFNDNLELADLTYRDPVAAQEMLNRRGMD